MGRARRRNHNRGRNDADRRRHRLAAQKRLRRLRPRLVSTRLDHDRPLPVLQSGLENLNKTDDDSDDDSLQSILQAHHNGADLSGESFDDQ